MDVSDIFQSSCVVTWKPPPDDGNELLERNLHFSHSNHFSPLYLFAGGSKIVHYLIERQDLSLKGGWHSVAEVPVGETTFKVEDLVHKKEYKFRVKAVNKFGAGIKNGL